MMQTVVFGAWSGCIASLALSLSLGLNETHMDGMANQRAGSAIPEYSSPTFLVAPIVARDSVSGFLFSQIVLEFKGGSMKPKNVPLDMILQDSYNTFLIGNADFSFPIVSSFDLEKFKVGLRAEINRAMGSDKVDRVFISQLNYIESGKVRSKQNLSKVFMEEDELQNQVKAKQAKPADKKSPGH